MIDEHEFFQAWRSERIDAITADNGFVDILVKGLAERADLTPEDERLILALCEHCADTAVNHFWTLLFSSGMYAAPAPNLGDLLHKSEESQRSRETEKDK